MKSESDFLQRFVLDRARVRGVLVRLDKTWRAVRERGDYPAPIARLLAEVLTASALFTGNIKFRGRLSIQLRGADPLSLLFAECTHEGDLRGLARWEGDVDSAIALDTPNAQLAITIENAASDTRYQGLVPVEGASLEAAFERYFERSEQLPTRLMLVVGENVCAGLMLQPLAAAGGIDAASDPDGWNRVGHLLATATPPEMLELAPNVLLRRLFHEEGVQSEPMRALGFGCSCTRERVATMLRALGQAESEASLDADGVVDVTCEFCNQNYRFDRVDVATLFARVPEAPGSPTPQ